MSLFPKIAKPPARMTRAGGSLPYAAYSASVPSPLSSGSPPAYRLYSNKSQTGTSVSGLSVRNSVTSSMPSGVQRQAFREAGSNIQTYGTPNSRQSPARLRHSDRLSSLDRISTQMNGGVAKI